MKKMIEQTKINHDPHKRIYISWSEQLSKLIIFVAVVYGIVFLWGVIGSALFPVVAGLLIAYLLNPYARELGRFGLSRIVSVLIIFAVLTSIFTLFFIVLYPVIKTEVLGVTEKVPVIIDTIETKLIPFLRDTVGIAVPTTISEAIEHYGANIKESFPTLLKRGGEWAFRAMIQTGSILSGAMNMILIPIFTFFFLKDFELILSYLAKWIPARENQQTVTLLSRINDVVVDWFRAQMKLTVILSLLYGTGLAIVFGLSGFGAMNGFAIGVLTGVLNIIPYVGVLIGFVLALAMGILNWSGFFPLIGIMLTFAVVQISDGYFITPFIVGSKVGLSTAGVLIALLIGGALLGLVGMLFAVPVAAILKVISPEIHRRYMLTRFYNEHDK